MTFRIECHPPDGGGDLACVGRPTTQAWIAVYSSTALVDDPVPPAVAPLSGTLVGPGWQTGTGSVEIAASDASGVKAMSLFAGDTKLFEREQSCDYSRMQPCPPTGRETVSVDTSKLADGTYALKAVATDAADQPSTASAVLKVDRHAPAPPQALAVERNPDGTMAFAWTNPDQGTAAPITGARAEVCDAAGADCVSGGTVAGTNIAQLRSVSIPAGEHVVRVWLQDEAGNSDPGNAATLTVDPTTVEAPSVLRTLRPVLDPGPATPPRFKVTKAQRAGATLALSGTIAKGATARITAKVSKGKATAALVTAHTKPKKGKWSLRVKLTPGLRRADAFYLTVTYAGETTYGKATVRRRLAKKPARRAGPTEELSLASRSAR